MKRLFLLLLVPLAMAQYSPPTSGQAPGGAAGGDLNGTYPNPGVAKLNGVAASNYVQSGSAPWFCGNITTANGAAYACTPTLLDGTPIPASLLVSPANGQQLIFIPDVTNTGGFTIKIDGVNARSARFNYNAALTTFQATTLIPGYSYNFQYRISNNRWNLTNFAPSLADGTTISNIGTTFQPIFALTSPALRGVTGSISGNLTLGTCDTGTATVTGATTAMSANASPTTYPGAGVLWGAYVSAPDTVTVVECGLAVVTPTATTYQVAVIQ